MPMSWLNHARLVPASSSDCLRFPLLPCLSLSGGARDFCACLIKDMVQLRLHVSSVQGSVICWRACCCIEACNTCWPGCGLHVCRSISWCCFLWCQGQSDAARAHQQPSLWIVCRSILSAPTVLIVAVNLSWQDPSVAIC